jgi:hypothetical protein
MKNIRNQESGQAIVLLVVSLVVLLGFTALAIDGGMVYSDRRHAQNAADTASLAGAGAAGSIIQNLKISSSTWACPSVLNAVRDTASDVAVLRAASNGYVITRINAFGVYPNEDNRVVVECTDTGANKYLDVKSQILAETQTSFAHLIYNGALQNRVEAVARVRAQSPIGLGNAVIALNPAACSGNKYGLQFIGTSVTTITGGGALTLGCLDVDGKGKDSSYIYASNVDYVGEWDGTYEDKFIISSPQNVPPPEDLGEFYIDAPDCSGLPSLTNNDYTLDGTIKVYSQGIYSSELKLPSGDFRLNPGLYCVMNSPDAFTFNGNTLVGNGVTIYAPNGSINLSGKTTNLSAPCTDLDPRKDECGNPSPSYPDPAIGGVLFYTNGDVTFTGGGDSSLTGLIYAPAGTVKLTGNSDISPTLNTQIIGFNVSIGGTAQLTIKFTEGNTYNKPARLDMLR